MTLSADNLTAAGPLGEAIFVQRLLCGQGALVALAFNAGVVTTTEHHRLGCRHNAEMRIGGRMSRTEQLKCEPNQIGTNATGTIVNSAAPSWPPNAAVRRGSSTPQASTRPRPSSPARRARGRPPRASCGPPVATVATAAAATFNFNSPRARQPSPWHATGPRRPSSTK